MIRPLILSWTYIPPSKRKITITLSFLSSFKILTKVDLQIGILTEDTTILIVYMHYTVLLSTVAELGNKT